MSCLYDMFIQPLIFIYDLIFTLLYRSLRNPGSSIIALSIAVNLLVSPIYRKADALQKDERAKKNAMAPWVNHIKRHFRGDEQYMILSTYYRQQNYSTFSFLKESIPVLLQLPFFVAAYSYISHLSILDGMTFGIIEDLSKPDAMLVLGSMAINVLPVMMTVINMMSGVVYSKDASTGERIQVIVTALVFLILLYNSPSGLVIYWTTSNVLSFIRNILAKLSDKYQKYFKAGISLSMLLLAEVFVVEGRLQVELAELLIIGSIVYMLFVLVGKQRMVEQLHLHFFAEENQLQSEANVSLLLLASLTLAILLGIYIPSTVIASSTLEFVNSSTGSLNYNLLVYPATLYLGLLLIWVTVFYYAFDMSGRQVITLILLACLMCALLNQFAFSMSFGTLYTDLRFDGAVSFDVFILVVNAEIMIFVSAACLWFFYKKPVVLKRAITVVLLALATLSVRNIWLIHSESQQGISDNNVAASYEGILRLSETGKNVVVFMLDRAIGGYVPYILDEKPELKESFRGFVYYPDTVSFGTHTNFASPALFGGYEYTPSSMNERDTETLEEKHNQALKLMPILFTEAGYDVTICDPPYAGYEETPDLSIYSDLPEAHTYNLTGKFSADFVFDMEDYDFESRQKHNFVMYGIYRTSPLILRSFIYDDGRYLYYNNTTKYTQELIDSYSVLDRLAELTVIDGEEKSSFLLLQNKTPHNPTPLAPPDYLLNIDDNTPTDSLEEQDYSDRTLAGRTMRIDRASHWEHYCINVATYQEIAKWLDYLKEEDVYDNTRIILVADHGYYLSQFDDLLHPDGLDIESLNPLLMVKDFDAQEEFSVSDTFMTNADVPSLAMNDIVDNPVNPYTGNPVNNDAKRAGALYVTNSDNWMVGENNGYIFDLAGGHWWSIHDSIYNMDNWKLVE